MSISVYLFDVLHFQLKEPRPLPAAVSLYTGRTGQSEPHEIQAGAS